MRSTRTTLIARSSLLLCLLAPALGCGGASESSPGAASPGAPAGRPLAGAGKPAVVDGHGPFVSLEGPVWYNGALLFSDVDDSKVWRMDPSKPPEKRYEQFSFDGQTNGLAGDPEGRLVLCERRAGRVTRVEKDGKSTVLVDKFEGKRLNAANDIAIRADGNIYFTDPKWGRDHDDELGFEGAFRIAPDGKVSLITRGMTRPNGIALSPKGDVLYIGDDTANEIRRYDVAKDGSVSGEKPFISTASVPGGKFVTPDGICMDVEGNLYVANNNEAVMAILAFDPQGHYLGQIDYPAKPSNCTFGGPDGKTLYATVDKAIYEVRVAKPGSP